jgi:hypothetical protein
LFIDIIFKPLFTRPSLSRSFQRHHRNSGVVFPRKKKFTRCVWVIQKSGGTWLLLLARERDTRKNPQKSKKKQKTKIVAVDIIMETIRKKNFFARALYSHHRVSHTRVLFFFKKSSWFHHHAHGGKKNK